ncbi:hypothetical protein GGS20DRAFT_591627 [Poronia punctata]|nr:hypothetical protein GGS20DRAFT_591627 [Poronia punctata]
MSSDWRQKEKVISSMLEMVRDTSIPEALNIYGTPMSGLDSTFVQYAFEWATAHSFKVIYLAATKISEETVLCNDGLRSGVGKNDYTGPLTIRAVSDLVHMFGMGEQVSPLRDSIKNGKGLVLIIEVTMLPDLTTEYMYFHLIQWLRDIEKKGKVAIFLAGSWKSERVMRAISRVVHTRSTSLRATESTPSPTVQMISGPDVDPNTVIHEAVSNKQRIILSYSTYHSLREELPSLSTIDISSIHNARHSLADIVHNSQCIEVDPTCLISVATDISVIVSSDRIMYRVFDNDTSQVIWAFRVMTQYESELVMAWATKSTVPVKVVTLYDPNVGRDRGSELFGMAWGAQLQELALMHVGLLSREGTRRIRDYPMLAPVHHGALDDRYRRLGVLGLVEKGDDRSLWRLTRHGKSMLQVCLDEKMWHLPWQSKWLVECATTKGYDEPVRRALLMMAAIISSQAPCFTRGSNMNPTLGALGPLCMPLLREKANQGMMWLFVGMILSNQERIEDSSPMRVTATLNNGIVMDLAICRVILSFYKQLCQTIGLADISARQWASTPLNAEQIACIEEELLWAFLHQQVYFPNNTATRGPVTGIEVGSYQDVGVVQGHEFLSINISVAIGRATTRTGGFNALYKELERAQDGTVFARGLTQVDVSAYMKMVKKTGIPWPDVIERV